MNPRTPRSVDGFMPNRSRGSAEVTRPPAFWGGSPSLSGAGKAIRQDYRLAGRFAGRERSPQKTGGRVGSKRKGIPEWLHMPLIIGSAMFAGAFAQNIVFGQLAVITYGVAALVLGIASRTSFILALLSMIATTLLLVFKGDVGLSQNFAVYTFLFLVVGVITLNRELKKEGGRIYSIRRNT